MFGSVFILHMLIFPWIKTMYNTPWKRRRFKIVDQWPSNISIVIPPFLCCLLSYFLSCFLSCFLLLLLLSFFFLFFLKKIIYEYPIHKKIKWSCCSGQSDIWRPGAPAVETLSSQPGLLQHPSKKPPELLRAPLKMQESIDATRLQRHSVYLEK